MVCPTPARPNQQGKDGWEVHPRVLFRQYDRGPPSFPLLVQRLSLFSPQSRGNRQMLSLCLG